MLRALTANPQAFAAAAGAAAKGDCDGLRAAISTVGITDECEVICEWFCTWTCMNVCLLLCRPFPFTPIENPLLEAFQFAASTTRLSSQPGLVARLTTAVGAGDVKGFESIVVELKLQRFCIQLCHWVCSLRCHVLCRCVCPPLTEAFFTHIGGLAYANPAVVASQANGNGLTAGNRAFFNTLRLNGDLSVVDGAPLVEYRFEVAPTSPHGGDAALPDPPLPTLPTPVPAAAWVPVTAAQIAPTQIGSFVRSIPVAPFFQEIAVMVNNPGGFVPGVNGIFNITPSGGADPGWIQVPPFTPTPPMVPLGTTGWRFTMGAGLPAFINLDTTKAMPSSVTTINETGVVAGASGNAPLETDVFFGVRMRLRNVGTTGDGTDAGTCDHIAVNNSNYNNISHHPYWPGGLFNPAPATDFEIGLCSIGIAELLANPCSDLTSSLTVNFSAAHSNLGQVTVRMEGPGGPYAFDLNAAAGSTPGENLFGTATPQLVGSPPAPAWTFANLPPCAYLLKLDIDVLLTTGDADITPEPLEDYIVFCKST